MCIRLDCVMEERGGIRTRSLWNVSVACVIVWVCFFNCLLFGMLSNRRWLVECAGMCFMGVCRLLGRLLLLLTITIVGSLWNGSVCFLWVCVGCFGGCFYCLQSLLSVACGMVRYVFYGCVSVAWEIVLIACGGGSFPVGGCSLPVGGMPLSLPIVCGGLV